METFAAIAKVINQKPLLKIFEEDENLSMLPEDTIHRLAEPNALLWELRVKLWKLIEDREAKLKHFGTAEEIKIAELINGICSESRFKTITDSKFKCEFLSRPIRNYENSAEDLVRAAQARIWEVLSLPIKDDKGIPDKALTKIVFDCAKMVIDRKYGQALQKTELYAKVQSHSLSITGKLTDKPEAIDAEIKRLEGMLNNGSGTGTSAENAEVTEITSSDGGEGKIPLDN